MNILKKIYELEEAKKGIDRELKALWKQVDEEGITEIPNSKHIYRVETKETLVRSIIAEKFLAHFGQDIFNRIAKVGVTDAENELGKRLESEAEEGGYLTSYTRVSKRVVAEKIKNKE